MVIATDEFIVIESLLLFVSSKPVTCIWYQHLEGVGSTKCLCWADMRWWGGDGHVYCYIL